jgi:hypothetical protein
VIEGPLGGVTVQAPSITKGARAKARTDFELEPIINTLLKPKSDRFI